MGVRITIETASKADAQLIAQRLPIAASAESWRGFGVIRVDVKDTRETKTLVDAVSHGFREHSLKWARVRFGDEERVFKANGKRTG
jgi:hypothetical protein